VLVKPTQGAFGVKIHIPAFVAWFVLASAVSAQIDRNTNGVSDVWESAYGWNLVPGEDPDGDHFSNAAEARAGTDPFLASSFPRSTLFTMLADDRARVQFQTVPGMVYQVEATTDLMAWRSFGSPVRGDGLSYDMELPFASTFAPGGVTASIWTGLNGYGVGHIAQAVSNNTLPSAITTWSSLEFAQTSPNAEQFGWYVRGWLVPPVSGHYSFWIASDDSSELWMSPSNHPAGRTRIAYVDGWTGFREWTKYASQQSAPQLLQAGAAYYFEVFQRESWGGDHLSVAWVRPGAAPDQREIIAVPYMTPAGESLGDYANSGDQLSLRLAVSHRDSDLDGLFDFEEHLLGLDPFSATTAPRQPDGPEALRILDSGNAVTIGATIPRAYESTASAAQFTFYRSGGIDPVTVPITVSGSALAGTDYQTLPNQIVFGPGERTATLDIVPLADATVEVAESVVVTLLPGTNYLLGTPALSTVTIDDAPDVLYVAQMRAAPGLPSGGSGVGAVRRTGNNLSGLVNLTFNGLSAAELAAEIILSSNGLSGTVVHTLPLDQVALQPWDFAATNGIARETILAALDAGSLWVRITTTAFPSGELIGPLLLSPGWQTMPEPPVPPPAPAAPANEADSARFLTQATFGPTDTAITGMSTNTFAAWIDHQLSLPATYHLPYVQARRAELMARDGNDGWQQPRQMAWWQHALAAPDQLRQRMAWALSQIMVVSQFGALDGEHEGITLFYDQLLAGAFGNYRDLIENVTLSPMMGIYLSMMRNQKPDPVTGHEPDENYAREIMQLFSIGLTEMHNDGSYRLDENGMPIPTYTQEDIVGLAHIFTGWSAHYDEQDPPEWSPGNIADREGWFYWGWDSMRPMSFYAERHDTLDRTIVGGTVIPGSTNGVERMRLALDTLFNHPNLGPFIARQLIQRFVTSNPSPGYIHRVAAAFNDNGSGVRGDLAATLRAVLLDYEARAAAPRVSVSFGKPIEPVMRLTRMLRAYLPDAPFAASGDPRLFLEFQWSMPEQVPQYASSVFNFYQPGYRQPGAIARSGLYSPEFQIFAETTAIREANLHYSMIHWGMWTPEPLTTNSNVILTLKVDPLVAILQTPGLTPTDAQEALINHLNTRFLFGAMSTALRNDLRALFQQLDLVLDFRTSYQRLRVNTALYLVLNSPEFLVQR
jgi:uncharacterized protein (DUF1800 family)